MADMSAEASAKTLWMGKARYIERHRIRLAGVAHLRAEATCNHQMLRECFEKLAH